MIYNISEFLDNMDIFDDNKRVSTVSYYSFVITYVLLMVFGCIGNISIIIACIRNKVWRATKSCISDGKFNNDVSFRNSDSSEGEVGFNGA